MEVVTPGNAEPCVFVSSLRGCAKGDGCRFSHLPHSEDSITRPRKARRQHMKERILQCFAGSNFDAMQEALQQEAQRHPYAGRVIQGYLNKASFIRFDKCGSGELAVISV
ncbi:unnamed protein product [Durusdinium trenchii]|uniref:C3H1-type domain-containing protein n=1 Tax=Durusdinium trenchii TaxID=1381693 RepID=A0ABP0P3J2_9DINO